MIAERIESIYKRKSYSKLKSILELLYVQYQRSRDEYVSVSKLAKKIEADSSNTRKSIEKMRKEGIVNAIYSEEKKHKAKKGGKVRRLYKLSLEAYNIIEKAKTAN